MWAMGVRILPVGCRPESRFISPVGTRTQTGPRAFSELKWGVDKHQGGVKSRPQPTTVADQSGLTPF